MTAFIARGSTGAAGIVSLPALATCASPAVRKKIRQASHLARPLDDMEARSVTDWHRPPLPRPSHSVSRQPETPNLGRTIVGHKGLPVASSIPGVEIRCPAKGRAEE